MAPLLVENEAISRYIAETGNLDLRKALPELVSVDEAVKVAVKEYGLTKEQAKRLSELLLALNR